MGNLGLIRAVQKYDTSKGTQFSTYATHWIQSFIRRHITVNQLCVYVPVGQIQKNNNQFKFKQIQNVEKVDYLLKDLGQQNKFERMEDLEKLTLFLDYFHKLLGTEDYQILLTSYGIYDHEKFKDNEIFDGFMDNRGQRIDFYQPFKVEELARLFGFDSKEKYQDKKSKIQQRMRQKGIAARLTKYWEKMNEAK